MNLPIIYIILTFLWTLITLQVKTQKLTIRIINNTLKICGYIITIVIIFKCRFNYRLVLMTE